MRNEHGLPEMVRIAPEPEKEKFRALIISSCKRSRANPGDVEALKTYLDQMKMYISLYSECWTGEDDRH